MTKYAIIFLSLISYSAIWAQDIKITHGPYLCDMASDGVTIMWTTNKPALSWVEVAPDDNKSFYATERPKHFATLAGRKLANKTLHKIRLSNLEAATNYRYRIFSQEVLEWETDNKVIYGKVVSSNVYSKKPFMFSTYPVEGSKVSFLVLNDIHGKSEFMTNLCKNVDFKKFDFVALNGDMSNSTESEDQIFNDFIDASVRMFASETPIMYSRGNHETRGVFADSLMNYFPTRDGRYYQLYKVGDICFLILDGGEDKPDSDIEYSGLADFDNYRQEEAEWLKEVVVTSEFKEAKSRIVFLHIPPYVGDWHGSEHLKKLFMPILNNANVDLMISGHTHRYLFHQANDNTKFPIVINDNVSYMECDIDNDKIQVRLVGSDNQNIRTHTFELK